jgi:hypothetical protein
MAKRKALSAVIILSAAFAAPVFAQDAVGPGYGAESQLVTDHRSNHRSSHRSNYRSSYRSSYRGPYDQNFRGAYNQPAASFYPRPLTNEERRNLEDFGFSGRDPSRVGGQDPYLHPSD